MQVIPLILAGGGGTRLWPLSRSHYPKQFLSVDGVETLLQGTLNRVAGKGKNPLSGLGRPIVICNEDHRFLVGEQARLIEQTFDTILLEPVGRNTAPALTAAALCAVTGGEDPLLLAMPADQLIRDTAAFRAAVRLGIEQASSGRLVTFGVLPTAPETGYGYIQLGAPVPEAVDGVHHIAAFREKPAREQAEKFIATGQFRWNAGIFLLRCSVWLDAMARYRPDILAATRSAVEQGSRDGEFFRLERNAFTDCPSDSIDYAVMERITFDQPEQTAVISLDAGWSDVGSWSSLWEVSPKDDAGNVSRGDVCVVDSKDTLVFSESRLVAAVGCQDLVIVETADAVLVMPREQSQKVKAVVDWLSAEKRAERSTHRRVYRPWGSYEGVDSGERFQVKRIVVKPGGSLSLQMHHHRAEHWIVVNGTARVTRGEEVFLLTENQSTFIPLGATHRLENPGTIALEMVEVQSGAYLGEDDIVRFEDKYRRT
jgi:mannose-1-phosphate guanylyltransferase/mannose-6-phosphate isomerase